MYVSTIEPLGLNSPRLHSENIKNYKKLKITKNLKSQKNLKITKNIKIHKLFYRYVGEKTFEILLIFILPVHANNKKIYTWSMIKLVLQDYIVNYN